MIDYLKKILLLLLGICLIVCCCSCQSNADVATQNEVISNDGYSRYQNGIFGFSVDFPSTWICESEPYRYSTEQAEGDPDSSVKIYIDSQRENHIVITGSHGKTTDSFVRQSDFIKTDIDEKRILYVKEIDGIFNAQFFLKGNDYITAYIKMDSKTYAECEEDIINVLKSICLE
jgi:hypothetical protein